VRLELNYRGYRALANDVGAAAARNGLGQRVLFLDYKRPVIHWWRTLGTGPAVIYMPKAGRTVSEVRAGMIDAVVDLAQPGHDQRERLGAALRYQTRGWVR
jgi:hypothetical protein